MNNPSVYILFSDEDFREKTIPLISASGYGYAGSMQASMGRYAIASAGKPLVVLYQIPRFTKKGFVPIKKAVKQVPGAGIIAVVDKISSSTLSAAFQEGVRGLLGRTVTAGGLKACLDKISEGGIFIDQMFTDVFVSLIKTLPAEEGVQHR